MGWFVNLKFSLGDFLTPVLQQLQLPPAFLCNFPVLECRIQPAASVRAPKPNPDPSSASRTKETDLQRASVPLDCSHASLAKREKASLIVQKYEEHRNERERSGRRTSSRRSQPEAMGTDTSAAPAPESTAFVLDSNATGTFLAARNLIVAGTLIMTDPGV